MKLSLALSSSFFQAVLHPHPKFSRDHPPFLCGLTVAGSRQGVTQASLTFGAITQFWRSSQLVISHRGAARWAEARFICILAFLTRFKANESECGKGCLGYWYNLKVVMIQSVDTTLQTRLKRSIVGDWGFAPLSNSIIELVLRSVWVTKASLVSVFYLLPNNYNHSYNHNNRRCDPVHSF